MASRKTPGSGEKRRRTTGALSSAASSELILYKTPDHQTRIEVRLEDETVWLSQRQLAELFQKSVPTINVHIGNVYAESELDPGAAIRKSRIVQTEGEREVSREVELYNLDVIISVGYRVKSHRGTQFRICEAAVLSEVVAQNVRNCSSRQGRFRHEASRHTSFSDQRDAPESSAWHRAGHARRCVPIDDAPWSCGR